MKQKRTRNFVAGRLRCAWYRSASWCTNLFYIIPPICRKDRLGLAQWLMDPKNPLTARVYRKPLLANLFWYRHSKNCGNSETRKRAFNMIIRLAGRNVPWIWMGYKSVQNLIVLSATYRQSSMQVHELSAKDRINKLLSRGPSSD